MLGIVEDRIVLFMLTLFMKCDVILFFYIFRKTLDGFYILEEIRIWSGSNWVGKNKIL